MNLEELFEIVEDTYDSFNLEECERMQVRIGNQGIYYPIESIKIVDTSSGPIISINVNQRILDSTFQTPKELPEELKQDLPQPNPEHPEQT